MPGEASVGGIRLPNSPEPRQNLQTRDLHAGRSASEQDRDGGPYLPADTGRTSFRTASLSTARAYAHCTRKIPCIELYGEIIVRMARRAGTAVGAFLACCGIASALNPSLDISQYAHTAWTVRDGFFKGGVSSIAQTADGYLWLGTESGVLRFDGVRTVPWHPRGDNHVTLGNYPLLLGTRDGTLWIGTWPGLISWKDGKVTQFPDLAQTFQPPAGGSCRWDMGRVVLPATNQIVLDWGRESPVRRGRRSLRKIYCGSV